MRSRLRAYVLAVLAAAVLLPTAEPVDPPGSRVARLPGVSSLADRLSDQGQADAARLLRDLLAAMGGDLSLESVTGTEFEEGWQLAEAEDEATRAFRDVPEEERVLLWELALDSLLPSPLRCRLVRLLDGSRPAPGILIRALQGTTGPVAWEAAVRLGGYPSPEAREALEQAATQGRGWGRQYALVGLARLGDPAAAEAVKQAAGDPSPAVRRHVALALAELGNPTDLLFLTEMAATSDDPFMQKVVIHARRRIRDRHPSMP